MWKHVMEKEEEQLYITPYHSATIIIMTHSDAAIMASKCSTLHFVCDYFHVL